jgi:hypothetical protein
MSDSAQDDTAAATEDVEQEAEAVEAGDPAAESGDIDDVKRKFREALDRKKQASAKDSTAAGARAAGKAHQAGGPASSRRQFRRKSG